MNGKSMLLTVVMAVAAGVTGFGVGKLHESAKTQKMWREVKDNMMESLKMAKNEFPEAWEEVMKDKGDELEEDFKKELEEL